MKRKSMIIILSILMVVFSSVSAFAMTPGSKTQTFGGVSLPYTNKLNVTVYWAWDSTGKITVCTPSTSATPASGWSYAGLTESSQTPINNYATYDIIKEGHFDGNGNDYVRLHIQVNAGGTYKTL